jgi:hypothetical protein
MELITILNRCHRFRARCHLPAPGYDQLAERRFEFIPLWGFLVFLLYTMRCVNCRRCGIVAVEEVPWGDGKRTLTKTYMLFLARWARLTNHLSLSPVTFCSPTSPMNGRCDAGLSGTARPHWENVSMNEAREDQGNPELVSEHTGRERGYAENGNFQAAVAVSEHCELFEGGLGI